MSISDNYNTDKRRTLEEIIKTQTAELSEEERQLLINLPSMSHEQLEARFTPEEIAWIERSHKLRRTFSRLPSQSQLKIFNSVADHLAGIAESFSPFVATLAQKYEAQNNGKKMKVTDQEAVLLRCVLAWPAHSARGEQMTDDLLHDIALKAFREQVSGALKGKKKAAQKFTGAEWSTAAVARAAAEQPMLWDGHYHHVTVHNNTKTGLPDKVQTIQVMPINTGNKTIEFARDLDKKTILGLQLVSNLSATMVMSGYDEFTAGQLAKYALGGQSGVNPALAEWFSELLDIGITTSATIWEEVNVNSDGSPIDDPLRIIRKELTGIVLPFDREKTITRSYEYTKYYPIMPGALPIFYRAAQRRKQILKFMPEWVHLNGAASLTDDRLFAVYYVLEQVMLKRKDYLSALNKAANRARRMRGKALSQEEVSKMALQTAREQAEVNALMNLRFDTLFEKLGIGELKQQQRMKNFLIDIALPEWVQDATMPLKDFTVNKIGKNRTGVKLLLSEPENKKRKK